MERARAIAELELDAARAWAARHRATLTWIAETLELRATFMQPIGDLEETFFLRGSFDGYREVPPIWVFTDETWGAMSRPVDSPQAAPPGGRSSMFISHNGRAVICAPFNRLAYAAKEGPHQDWGGPELWLSAGPNLVHAATIGDMLQAIHRDLVFAVGRLS
jgi:hypothetical protein